MKYSICAAALAALLSAPSSTSAVQLSFTDDLVKSLAEDMATDANKEEAAAPEQAAVQVKSAAKTATKTQSKAKTAKKAVSTKSSAKKVEQKAATKKDEDNEIPMDAAAIKAYSSVIADAAEDSEPSQPVVYTKTIPDEPREQPHESLDFDPMGSIIQNEISSIKDASIKAANENSE